MRVNVAFVRSGLLAASVLSVLVSSTALADDKAECLDASSQAQTLRDAHKPLEARQALRVCARAVCPAVVRRDCTTWLDDVEHALPSVVLSMKDAQGKDVLAVTVTLDGKPFVEGLTGAALPVDPGAHTFRFQTADGAVVEEKVLVGEGQRDLIVAARAMPLASQIAAPPAHDSTRRTAGWIVGGVGVAGLIVGGVFGALAAADKGSASCTNNQCTNFGEVGSAKTAASVADAGLIAGGVLVLTGGALVVLSPNAARKPTATSGWLTLAPSVAPGGGGLVVRGAF